MRGRLRLTVLAALLATALGLRGSSAAEREPYRGACYCRMEGRVECTDNLTERQCDLQAAQALCDDWFWLERLPCWNWGYGG
jgi:hypothetical protein